MHSLQYREEIYRNLPTTKFPVNRLSPPIETPLILLGSANMGLLLSFLHVYDNVEVCDVIAKSFVNMTAGFEGFMFQDKLRL